MFTLGIDTYRTKVLGCWMGKNIGGTLGQPHEGRQGPLSLTFYDPVPDGALANDDLELQLVWLAKLREVGPGITEHDLGQAWRNCLTYPWDEYGIGKANLFLGLEPPVSGQHNNWFTDSMGAPIRSEIWACVAPGCPDLATALAYQDGCVDHGGEGLFGEIFFAALESAAFVCDDRNALLELGLSFLPPDCRTAIAVRACLAAYAAGADWLGCRQAILDRVGHVNFTDAPQNIAFTVLGWLYGEDAGHAMCLAVNCGCDTDCTGATLGAILGIIHGPGCFAKEWIDPVGDEVKTGYGVINCQVPKTLDELTDWTVTEARRMLAAHDAPVRIGEADDLGGLTIADLAGQGLVSAKLVDLDWKITTMQGGVRLVTDYGGEPTIAPGQSLTLTFSAYGDIPPEATFEVTAPRGWSVRPGASHREPGLFRRCFRIEQPAAETPSATYRVVVSLLAESVQLATDTLTVVAKHGWRITGPYAFHHAGGSLDLADLHPLIAKASWRTVNTDGHALVLDAGLDFGRLYVIDAVLHNPHPQPGRIVCAPQERQVVYLGGREIILKPEPTPFVPAPHRSGPGTAHAMDRLPEELPIRIWLVARPNERAELHLYLTEPADESLRRCCPIVGVFGTGE